MRLLRSRALALGLLIFVFAAITLGMIVPQESLMPPSSYLRFLSRGGLPAYLDRLGLTRLFTSWWFLLTGGLLLLSLVVCTFDQFSLLSRSRASSPWSRRKSRRYTGAGEPDGIVTAVSAELDSAGFRVDSARDRHLVAGEQHRLGRYGTVLFHLGIILTFLGFLVSQLAGFRGEAQITEGRPFVEEHASFQRFWEGPLFRERHSGLVFVVDRMNPWFTRPGYAPDVQSAFSVYEPSGLKIAGGTVVLNEPLSVRGLDVTPGTVSGYAVFLEDRPLAGGQARIQGVNLLYQGRNLTDLVKFRFPGVPYDIALLLRPLGPSSPAARFRGPFPRPRRPAIELTLKNGNGGTASRALRLGRSLDFGGHRFTFLQLRYWSVFSVSYDPGSPVIELAFLIGCLGLLIRYVWEQRRVRVEVTPEDGHNVVKVVAGDWFWLADEHSKSGRLRERLEAVFRS